MKREREKERKKETKFSSSCKKFEMILNEKGQSETSHSR